MSLTYQLRVDHPDHPLRIYDLDESKGVTTIGQDPPNDILLAGLGPAPFQVVLDHSRQPHCFTVPSQAERVRFNDGVVRPGKGYEINDEDVLEVAGYTIVFRVYEEQPAAEAETPPPEPELLLPEPELLLPEEPLPPSAPEEPAGPGEETAAPAAEGEAPPEPPAPAVVDRAEPAIVTSLPQQEWTVDVGQTITLLLTVINAGEFVAQFDTAAEGVPAEWVTITPAEVHLNERAQTTITITVTPPHLPTSRAGAHHLKLVVTSPTYPKERSETRVVININPYYELAVGNLSPRRQAIPWSEPAGQAQVPLSNKGNSEVLVGLTGEDDSLACRFEFEIPDEMEEPVYLTRQVQLCMPFNGTLQVPVKLVPTNRPLIGRGGRLIDTRPRVNPYTVTVTAAQGQQGPFTLYGEWENTPRFSRRLLLATVVGVIALVLALTCAIFNPVILSHYAKPASIRAGQVVELGWTAWPPFFVSYKLDGRSVNTPASDRPQQTTTYELRADTWLSRLWPALAETEKQTVEVRPVKPDILLFEAAPERVMPGQKAVLSWVVDDADQVVLIDHNAGLEETLASPWGSREIKVGPDPARYTLRAAGADGVAVERVVTVDVGAPVIRLFSVEPGAVPAGKDVTLAWAVLGADELKLHRSYYDANSGAFVREPVDLAGPGTGLTRQVDSTTVFTLTAIGSGTEVVDTAWVKVLRPAPAVTPSPTPTPLPAAVHSRNEKPGVLVVYTALSSDELSHMGAVTATSLTELPASFKGTKLELAAVQKFDYVHVVTREGAPPINSLIVQKSTQDLIRQLQAEKENPQADVIWMVAATGMIRLRAEGLLEPLAGVYEPRGMASIKPGWRDPTLPSHWLGLTAWQAALCVNERHLKPGIAVPASWAALKDIDYRGEIAMPNPYHSGSGYMVVSGLLQNEPLGEPAGWATLDLLHENIAAYTHAGSEPCRLVAQEDGSDIAIGIGVNLCAQDEKLAGLTVVYPAQGSGWEMDAVALVRKPTINDAALEFVAWAISQDAMQQYSKFRSGFSVDGFQPQRVCSTGFDEDQVLPARLLWAGANYRRITEKWLGRYGSESDLLELEPGQ